VEIKTHIIQYSNLKTTLGDKYLNTLEQAGYIVKKTESRGTRQIIVYELTDLGKGRLEWLKTMNIELFGDHEWLE
jgi:predicted transcriptional regulator